MSIERITAIIADAVAENMPEGDGGQDGSRNLITAREILAALRANRIAVVALPDSWAWSGDVDIWPSGRVKLDGRFADLDQIHALAAALLAARSGRVP